MNTLSNYTSNSVKWWALSLLLLLVVAAHPFIVASDQSGTDEAAPTESGSSFVMEDDSDRQEPVAEPSTTPDPQWAAEPTADSPADVAPSPFTRLPVVEEVPPVVQPAFEPSIPTAPAPTLPDETAPDGVLDMVSAPVDSDEAEATPPSEETLDPSAPPTAEYGASPAFQPDDTLLAPPPYDAGYAPLEGQGSPLLSAEAEAAAPMGDQPGAPSDAPPAPVEQPAEPPLVVPVEQPAEPPLGPDAAPVPSAEPAAPPAPSDMPPAAVPQPTPLPPMPLGPIDNAPIPSASDMAPNPMLPTMVQPPPVPEPAPIQPPPAVTPVEDMVAAEGVVPEVIGDSCNLGCPKTWYTQVSAVYFNRNEPFDFDLGFRFTVGYIHDCLDGIELSYMGPFDWIFQKTVVPDDRVPVHHEYRATLQNIEVSRKWWGWDVISTMIGLRYVYIGEQYRLDRFETALFGENGFLHVKTRNNVIGPQLGLDLYFPLGRWNSTLRAKTGIFANATEGDVRLDQLLTDETLVSNGEQQVQFAWLGELGWFGSYRLLPNVTVFAGYELWYLYGIAEATGQKVAPQTFDRTTGLKMDSNGDVYYHGGSVGVEVAW